MDKKILKICKKFRIKIEESDNDSCYYEFPKKKIYITKNASNYNILHEIGHCIYGFSCCREHDEYIAHGIAVGLARAYNIKLHGGYKSLIDCYAGWSSHKSCGAIEKRKKEEKKK